MHCDMRLLWIVTFSALVTAKDEYSTIYGPEPKSQAFAFPAAGWAVGTLPQNSSWA